MFGVIFFGFFAVLVAFDDVNDMLLFFCWILWMWCLGSGGIYVWLGFVCSVLRCVVGSVVRCAVVVWVFSLFL